MSKHFGALKALQDVSVSVPAGSFHALLGENGAGKSTLVKCTMGFYTPDKGQLLIDGVEVAVRNPRDAQALGVGMVYQHFTLVPALTAAENLVVSRADAPAFIDWRKERRTLEAFLAPPPPPCAPARRAALVGGLPHFTWFRFDRAEPVSAAPTRPPSSTGARSAARSKPFLTHAVSRAP